MNDLSHGIKMWAEVFFVSFRFITIQAFDRHTDGQTDIFLMANTAVHIMQRGKNKSDKRESWPEEESRPKLGTSQSLRTKLCSCNGSFKSVSNLVMTDLLRVLCQRVNERG